MSTSPNIDYGKVELNASESLEPFRDVTIRELTHLWCEAYKSVYPESQLREFEDQGAQYIFDEGADNPDSPEPRTIAAFGLVRQDYASRDAYYQAGFPIRQTRRPVDRGHLMPHSAGGLYGPNMITQDRALNRGWSAQGKRYRAIERLAVSSSENMLFCRPIYTDSSDYPERIDLGFISKSGICVGTFLNREDRFLRKLLAGGELNDTELIEVFEFLTDAELGDIGEETARAYLEDEIGATIVALGDSRMPRNQGRQDLDIVAIVDGELMAFEVKTTYSGGYAGRRTRTGNLYSPPLRRRRKRADGVVSYDQSTDGYIRDRVASIIEVDDSVALDSRVIKVDLRGLVLQEFEVKLPGRRRYPRSPVASCGAYVRTAMRTIVDHRGWL